MADGVGTECTHHCHGNQCRGGRSGKWECMCVCVWEGVLSSELQVSFDMFTSTSLIDVAVCTCANTLLACNVCTLGVY